MSYTMSLQVSYTFWYFSLLCSAKQHRGMTSLISRFYREQERRTVIEFFILHLTLSDIRHTDSAPEFFGHFEEIIRVGTIAKYKMEGSKYTA